MVAFQSYSLTQPDVAATRTQLEQHGRACAK